MEEVTFTFNDDGTFELETKGYAGASCRQATKDVEKALGKKTSDTPTAEMSKPVKSQQKVGGK